MREILFRGKFGEEWKYGYLIVEPKGLVIKEPYELNQSNIWHIDSETIGQYTGLVDKNGTKIFDGDIAELKRFGDTCVGKIIFNHKTAGFEFWWNVIVGAYGEKATHQANMSVSHEINVIGNIYDNPELLTS